MSTSADPTRTPRSPARRALAATRAALISAFHGTQPMLGRSPPITWLSTSATRAVPEGPRAGGRAGKTDGSEVQKPSLSPRVKSVIASCRENPKAKGKLTGADRLLHDPTRRV